MSGEIKDSKFEELKIRVNILNNLLQDPQLGLMTWCESYGQNMEWIVAYWKGELP